MCNDIMRQVFAGGLHHATFVVVEHLGLLKNLCDTNAHATVAITTKTDIFRFLPEVIENK